MSGGWTGRAEAAGRIKATSTVMLDKHRNAGPQVCCIALCLAWAGLVTPAALAGSASRRPSSRVNSGSDGTAIAPPVSPHSVGYRERANCLSQVGYGPLNLPSQSPFQGLRAGVRPRTPSTLARGRREVQATATWTSLWSVDDDSGELGRDFFIDHETLQTRVGVAFGLTDRLQIEGALEVRSRFGGLMDGPIESWHDFFNLPQNNRTRAPKDNFVFRLSRPGAAAPVDLGRSARGTFSRSVEVSVHHSITCGEGRGPALSYAVTAGLETDGDSVASGVDVAGSLHLARRIKRVYFYGTLGYARFGDDALQGLKLEDSQLSALGAFEWRFVRRHSLVVQYMVSEGQLDGFDPFSGPAHEIVVGWKGEVSRGGVLEAGIVENIVSIDNSPDFGLHLGFSRRF